MDMRIITVQGVDVAYDASQPAVARFDGLYAPLSNFFPAPTEYRGEWYATSEHAYLTQKFTDLEIRTIISIAPTPGQAKRLSKQFPIRADWETIKVDVMLEALLYKFEKNEYPRAVLCATHGLLVEGNTWHDTFWGVCNGVGDNMLGKLLMLVRQELQ